MASQPFNMKTLRHGDVVNVIDDFTLPEVSVKHIFISNIGLMSEATYRRSKTYARDNYKAVAAGRPRPYPEQPPITQAFSNTDNNYGFGDAASRLYGAATVQDYYRVRADDPAHQVRRSAMSGPESILIYTPLDITWKLKERLNDYREDLTDREWNAYTSWIDRERDRMANYSNGGAYEPRQATKAQRKVTTPATIELPRPGTLARYPDTGTNYRYVGIFVPFFGFINLVQYFEYKARTDKRSVAYDPDADVYDLFATRYGSFTDALTGYDQQMRTDYRLGRRYDQFVVNGSGISTETFDPILFFYARDGRDLKRRFNEAGRTFTEPPEQTARNPPGWNTLPPPPPLIDVPFANEPAPFAPPQQDTTFTLDELAERAYTPDIMAKIAIEALTRGSFTPEMQAAYGSSLYNYVAEPELKAALPHWQSLSSEQRAKLYFTALASSSYDNQRNFTSADTLNGHAYTLSMFCPKPDPLGRYILCDLFAERESKFKLLPKKNGYWNPTILLTYAGVATPFVLGMGAPKSSENEGATFEGPTEDLSGKYIRMHSPNGVKSIGTGLGTVLYAGTAVVAALGDRYKGSYSGGSRSSPAQAWWENAARRKLTFPSLMNGSGGTAYDMLAAAKVLKLGLIPFCIYANSTKSPKLSQYQRPSWNSVIDPSQLEEQDLLTLPENLRELYEEQRFGEVCANMLARSSFGASPRLAMMILDTLTKGGHDELARQFLARKDIAVLMATNQTAMGLLNGRAIDGFRGMSARRVSHVLSGLDEGLEPSHDSENPLNIPPMPASIKRKLDALTFEG